MQNQCRKARNKINQGSTMLRKKHNNILKADHEQEEIDEMPENECKGIISGLLKKIKSWVNNCIQTLK